MKKNRGELSVAAKISAVVSLHNRESPGVPLSVSSLAKQAGVSRANLYVSHLSFIEGLRNRKLPTAPVYLEGENSKKIIEMKAEIVKLRKTNSALLLVNGALRDRVSELQKRLNDVDQRSRRRRS